LLFPPRREIRVHRKFLLLAAALFLFGFGFAAEVLDWSPIYGPKTWVQTAFLALGCLSSASVAAILGVYSKEPVEPPVNLERIFCSYCDTENIPDYNLKECSNCHLSCYLQFAFR